MDASIKVSLIHNMGASITDSSLRTLLANQTWSVPIIQVLYRSLVILGATEGNIYSGANDLGDQAQPASWLLGMWEVGRRGRRSGAVEIDPMMNALDAIGLTTPGLTHTLRVFNPPRIFFSISK